ncbi:hypothetical protein [Actinoplanes sp. NPDC051851]|uniref:hypothetical protein n=1 Tax=Actinoplanes sp. NPDC051851 TaxID=3154753 RepID=UPI00342DD9E5
MSRARDLRIPDDVATALGLDQANQLIAGPWPAQFRCAICGRQDRFDTGTPITAGLDLHPSGAARLWFTHLSCSPGGIITKDHELPSRDNINAAGIAGLTTTPRADPWPFIIVELTTAALDEQGPDSIDLIINIGIQHGMHPVGDLQHPPPKAPGWRVDLPAPGRPGAVHDPDAGTLLQPLPPLPQGWLEATQRHGNHCGIYLASRAGLSDHLDGDQPEALQHAIRAAGAAGRLVGVTAAVQP